MKWDECVIRQNLYIICHLGGQTEHSFTVTQSGSRNLTRNQTYLVTETGAGWALVFPPRNGRGEIRTSNA